MAQPKILVGCPVSDYHAYCTKEYVKAIKHLTYPLYAILLADNSKTNTFLQYLRSLDVPAVRDFFTLQDVKKRIASSRDLLRKKVLEGDYDYFLSLEQDVIPPKDVLEKLLRHHKPIVSGVYYAPYFVRGKQYIFPVLWRDLTEEEQAGMRENKELLEQLNPGVYKDLVKSNFDFSQVDVRVKLKPEEVEQLRLITVKQCGLGCVLIAREVLERITFRVDDEKNIYDDPLFCKDVKDLGYALYVDTSVKCKHLVTKRPWTWEELDKHASGKK